MVVSNQALTRADVPTKDSETSDHIDRYVELLQRRHGISGDAALVLALASLSAAVGPSRTIKNPLGGSVSAALNVIVENIAPTALRRAANQALSPFQEQVERKVAAHQEKGSKHLRQLRMELEQKCARAYNQLHSPPERSRQPLTIPVPAEERKKEALTVAVAEAEQVAERLRLFEFEERPFLVVDGLSARDIPTIPQRTFDGTLLNFSPAGDVLRQLETMRLAEQREVLRYLVAAWHGKPFVAGSQTILNPSLTNLWMLATGDTKRAWRNPAMAASGLLETFLVIASDDPRAVDIESFATTAADDDWRSLLDVVLGERIMGDACEHQLSESAARRFLEFHVDIAHRQTPDSRKFVAWWPEQILKIALFLHLDSVHEELPKEIGLATLEAAINVMERLGAAQLRVVQSSVLPQDDFDAQIEVMVTKIKINGPMPKWKLYQRYHSHPVEVMEPILARCCERKLLRVEDDVVRLADAGQ